MNPMNLADFPDFMKFYSFPIVFNKHSALLAKVMILNSGIVPQAKRLSQCNFARLGEVIACEKIKPTINWLKTITEVSQTIFNVVTSLKVTGIIP